MSTTFYPVIGLEIHAELKTNSKMFCACKNDPDEERPNTNICPICMGHPGTLPFPNREAITNVLKVGLALGSNLADFTEFDRKHYFYPDIPKGYQISQYKYPLVEGGALNLPRLDGGRAGGFGITRIHLEEDTGLSKHDRGDFTLVDYNRAGVPLMELVTEPVIHSAKDAADFARELQLLLRTLGVSEANLEKGEMRVEPNISISNEEGKFGTKVEVKNLNSFKSVEKAIAFELERMQSLYEAGRENEIVQETRGWDENKQKTFSQRSKENANDYRYFPDPDIPKFKLSEIYNFDDMRAGLPELPWQKRERYMNDFGLKKDDAIVFTADTTLAEYFEDIVDASGDTKLAQTATNYLLSDMLGIEKKEGSVTRPSAAHFAELIVMVSNGDITSRGAKDLLVIMMRESVSPKALAKEKGLLQDNSEESLKPVIDSVIAQNEKIVADYKSGKEAALQALVGQTMKMTKGASNPEIAKKLLLEALQ